MEYKIIALKEMDYGECGKKENANVALIERKMNTKYPEYAVVRNLDVSKPMENNCQWDATICYTLHTVEGLQACIEEYRIKTEENYIPRCRLEELATNFKDKMLEWMDTEDLTEVCDEFYISKYEREFFGIDDIYKEGK